MTYNEKYEKRKASGKCIDCGMVKEDANAIRCKKCAVKHRVAQKQHRMDKDTQEKIRLLNIIREMVGYEG